LSLSILSPKIIILQLHTDFDDKLRSLMAERDELTTRLMHINGIPEETIHGGNKANRTKYINKFNRRINEIDDTLARINSTSKIYIFLQQ